MQEATQLSHAKRALLDRYLRGQSTPEFTVGRRPQGVAPPLSAVQEQLYIREMRIGGNPPLYNECITIRMQGGLDDGVLERSFNEILRRHEAWRTSFETKAGDPVQIIHPAPTVRLQRIDLRGVNPLEREPETMRLVGEEVRRPFQLDEVPLLRPILVRTGNDEHRLFLIAHQIILDGRSAYQIYPLELATLYKAFLAGRSSPLPELQIQSADFAWWQREWLQDQKGSQVSYWRKQLCDHSMSECPREKQDQGFCGNVQPFAFSIPASKHIKELSRRLNSTLFLVLLSGLAKVMSTATESDDIILGTLSPSGRKRSEVMPLLGYFLNPVALRLKCRPDFRELLCHAGAVVSEAMSNDDVPIESIGRELGGDDSVPYPFFKTAISLQPPSLDLGLPWSVTSMDIGSGGSPWPLYLAFIDTSEGIVGRAQFNPRWFEAATVQGILQDLQNTLETVGLE